ncbi:hypothetical protein [Nocardia aobensis]|uniref:hypothetical protein n=1 Tax=Nocardia aobensis TaxID=257277 RepID=UPI0002F6803F|nr:hypothetical protein [Nocardia aobensis]
MDEALIERLTTEASTDGIQQLVVGAVIHHDGKVLLLQRPEDDFMGGHLGAAERQGRTR